MHSQETFTDQIQWRGQRQKGIRRRAWFEDLQKSDKGEWSRNVDRPSGSAGRKDQGTIVEAKKALRVSAIETRRKEEGSPVKNHSRGASIHIVRDAHEIPWDGNPQVSRSTELTHKETAAVANETIELQASISE
jgi:hypothetical protein